jgi:hypothetical protein
MTTSSIGTWEIPTIWSSQFKVPEPKKSDISMFDNAPSDITVWSFFWKILIWIIVWICVAGLLFWSLTAIGWLTDDGDWMGNPILWVLLPVVWFIVSLVWNVTLAWLYSVFFSKRYYNFSKMFGLIFVASLLIFPLFIIISALYHFVFKVWIDPLYFILKIQIIFSLFISLNLVDFLSQPNYSASSLMWNTIWTALALVVALFISWGIVLVTVSAITTYMFAILWAWIWDAIYYKFYEWWNNPFYLPSMNELREERQKEEVKKAKDEEEVNVEIK